MPGLITGMAPFNCLLLFPLTCSGLRRLCRCVVPGQLELIGKLAGGLTCRGLTLPHPHADILRSIGKELFYRQPLHHLRFGGTFGQPLLHQVQQTSGQYSIRFALRSTPSTKLATVGLLANLVTFQDRRFDQLVVSGFLGCHGHVRLLRLSS